MNRRLFIKLKAIIEFFIIMALLFIGFLIDKNLSEKFQTPNQKEPAQTQQKNQIQIAKTTSLVIAESFIEKQTLSESEYKQLSIDTKKSFYSNCLEYFSLIKNGNEPLVTQVRLYGKLSGKPLQEAQINALKAINKKCQPYVTYQDRLKDDLRNDLFLNYSSNLNSYLKELNQMARGGQKNLAINDAENHLFHHNKKYRYGALGFLSKNPNWIESINQQLEIRDISEQKVQECMARSIELRSCELNLEDCSKTSFGMLLNCLYDYETCGYSLYEHTLQFTIQSDLALIELYLDYFRKLHK